MDYKLRIVIFPNILGNYGCTGISRPFQVDFMMNDNLVGGWPTPWLTYPSEKYESQLGLLFPIYGKKTTTNQQCMCFFFPTTFHTPKYPKCGDSINSMFNLTQNATFYNKQINWKTPKNDKTKNTQIAPECFVFVFVFYGDSGIPNLHLFPWKTTKKQQNRNKLRQSADLGSPSLQRKKQKRNKQKT